jgi:hypothetical protein
MSQISKCCGAAPIGEVFDTIGFCSDCKDHAEFEDEEEFNYEDSPQCECGVEVQNEGDHCTSCQWHLKH